MPDLITHIAATHLIVRLPSVFRNRILNYYNNYKSFIFLGAIFPDIISKPFQYISPRLYNFSLPLHSPFVVLITAYILTRFIYIKDKNTSFYTIAFFSVFHILLDNFQKGLNPGYQTFFPFSLKRYGFNLISSEIYIYIMIVLLFFSFIVEIYFYYKKRDLNKFTS